MKSADKNNWWFEELKEEKRDMQGLIKRGYRSLNAAEFILLEIDDPGPAKEYFHSIIEHITTAEKSRERDPASKGDPREAVHIAFTSSGLKKLIPPTVLATFSRVFIDGMSDIYNPENGSKRVAERSTLLGDTKNNDPACWHWGNKDYPVDCVIMLYAADNDNLDRLIEKIYPADTRGLVLVKRADTYEYDPNIMKEHFGFRDGISQPIIRGLKKSSLEGDDAELLNPGEIILGYLNEYNNYSPSPYICNVGKEIDLPEMKEHKGRLDLGKNGTYLVFRQIEQHVEKFWDYNYHHSKEEAGTEVGNAVKLAAKMIGRWPEGQPLVTCPDRELSMEENELNDFYYEEQDKDGLRCPLGAHIRRTNPRDQVHTGRNRKQSLQMTSRHRMLRRGRIYGPPFKDKMDIDSMILHVKNNPLKDDAGKDDFCITIPPEDQRPPKKTEIKRGLHFICLVSDIGRQFEFVQNVWANTSTFGDLCNEVDPIISPRPTKDQQDCHEFTTPQDMVRNRYRKVPEFTTVVGGAYFFMPGIKALNYIISGNDITRRSDFKNKPDYMPNKQTATGCPMEKIGDISDRILGYIRVKLIKRHGNKRPLRTFHAKTIGLVKGTLTVNDDLDEDYRVGLFKKPGTYDTWIRFTNGAPGIAHDKKTAARGMAIKVLVPQASEMPGGPDAIKAQDIILFNSPTFVPGTIGLQADGVKFILGPWFEKVTALVKIIFAAAREALKFLKAVKKEVPNVLEEKYYSATPYSFGKGKPIKWQALPNKTVTSLMPGNPSKDFLRDRLIRDLSGNAKEEVSFELRVQFQRDEETDPLEDTAVMWEGDFTTVATITIPKQDINVDERWTEDQNMSFSPGNALDEHAALGDINKLRIKLYDRLARERSAGFYGK